MSSSRRVCVFCGGRANSVEHIFKRDFKKTLDIIPFEREYSHVDIEGNTTSRPDPLFELKVRRVCRECNSGWMNDLDMHVEPWVVDPDDQAAFHACHPGEFRRWAIKLGLMRSLIDNPRAVPAHDAQALYAGDDIDSWHIYVGRACFKEWRHACSIFGAGWDGTSGSVGFGLIHVSWAVGAAVVSALRMEGEGEGAEHFLTAFVNYNKNLSEPLVEVLPGSVTMPDIFTRQKLLHGQTEPIFLFFSGDPISPVAEEMRRGYAAVRNATKATP
jgi:hypothetical protein